MSEANLQPVLLTLPSLSPSLAVEVLPYGLTIHRILVNGDGKTHDIVIGPNDTADHAANRRFINTIVGRYSNRIPVGEFDLEKNGIKSHLSVSATESPRVNLHGGAEGFDRRNFEVVHPSDQSAYSLFSQAEKEAISQLPASAIFKLTSPDGDQGFPGKLDIEVLVSLILPGTAPKSADPQEMELGSLLIVYRAKLADGQPKTVTPVNLTQHWGFNLEASLANPGEPLPDVKGHHLTIDAPYTIALHADGLATGELDPSSGTPHEHKQKLIGDKFPEKGYDSFYVFDKPSSDPSLKSLSQFESLDVVGAALQSSSSEPPVSLSSTRSGVRLSFETNQPGVQFYTGNFLGGQVTRKKIHGGADEPASGEGYQNGSAAFLEFHEPLAAWLHPWGRDGKDTLLTSDEIYNNYTKLNVYYKSSSA